MKLFQYHDYLEGETFTKNDAYANNVILSYGRKYQMAIVQTLVDPKLQMSAMNRVYQQNGFYIKLELPIAFKRGYIDPLTFTYKTGYCRPLIMFTRRTVHGHTWPTNFWTRIMKPLNPDTDPVNIKKNLAAFGGPVDLRDHWMADDSVTFNKEAK